MAFFTVGASASRPKVGGFWAGSGSGWQPPEEPGAPILGIKNFLGEVANIPSGLFRLGQAGVEALTGSAEDEDIEFLKAAGKGIGRSFLSTATTIADIPTGGLWSEEGGLADRALSEILPEDWEPESFYKRARERGAISALVEDVGNVAAVASLGATAAGAAATRLGAAGRGFTAAQAAEAAVPAARAMTAIPGLEAALGAEGRVAAQAARAGVAETVGGRAAVARKFFPDVPVVGTGEAGAMQGVQRSLQRVASPYRSFLMPAARKAAMGGTFTMPKFFGRGEQVTSTFTGPEVQAAGPWPEAPSPATVVEPPQRPAPGNFANPAGEPTIRVYHGTTPEAAEAIGREGFNKPPGTTGWFSPSRKAAQAYAERAVGFEGKGAVVEFDLPVSLTGLDPQVISTMTPDEIAKLMVERGLVVELPAEQLKALTDPLEQLLGGDPSQLYVERLPPGAGTKDHNLYTAAQYLDWLDEGVPIPGLNRAEVYQEVLTRLEDFHRTGGGPPPTRPTPGPVEGPRQAVTRTVSLPKKVTVPEVPWLKERVQSWDMKRSMKRSSAQVQADVRGGVMAVQQVIHRPIPGTKGETAGGRFTELTPNLTRAQQSAVLFEEIGRRATLGDDTILPEAADMARRRNYTGDTDQPLYREYNKLTPEQKAEVDSAFTDEHVHQMLNDAVPELAKFEAQRLEELGGALLGEKGLTPEELYSTAPNPTKRQLRRLSRAQRLRELAEGVESTDMPTRMARLQERMGELTTLRARKAEQVQRLSDELYTGTRTVTRRGQQVEQRVPVLIEPPQRAAAPTGGSELARQARRAQVLEDTERYLARLDRDIADLNEMLADPSGGGLAEYAARMREEAQAILDDVHGELEAPLPSQLAARWQPLARALHDIRRERLALMKVAGFSDELAAQMLSAEGLTWSSIIQRASAHGFQPVHIRDFSTSQVKKLVHDSISVGVHLREAQTRKARIGSQAATAEHSLEALAASFTEVALEVRSGEVLQNIIHNGWAQNVPADGVVPDGWVRFRPSKQGVAAIMLNAEDRLAGATPRDLMMPASLVRTLKWMTHDYDNIVTRSIAKVTSPWRAVVLTASPKWYFNNLVGNVIMASAQGVRMSDWLTAWRKSGLTAGDIWKEAWYRRYPELDPRLKRISLAGEARAESVAGGMLPRGTGPRSSFRQAKREAEQAGKGRIGQGTEVLREVGEHAQRFNQVFDEWARAALFEKEFRRLKKAGWSETQAAEKAVDMAVKGLVDYTNLTPFERQIVRTLIPFYAWQKGIFEMASRLAIDHPARVRVTMMLGQVNNELQREEMAEMPDAYKGLIPLPGDRFLRTQSMNPFADAASVIDPDRIRDSFNPFINVFLNRIFRVDESSGFGPKELDRYGRAVPSVSVGGGFLDVLTSTPGALPFKQVLESSRTPGEAASGFFGPSVLDAQTLQAAQSRQRRALQQIASGSPVPPQEGQGTSSGGAFFSAGQARRRQGGRFRAPVTWSNQMQQARQ